MAKKNSSIADTLEQLKVIHAANAGRVSGLQAQIAVLQAQLTEAQDAAIQTEDAINALEGKPTLKKMLEASLAAAAAAPPSPFDAGGPPNVHPAPAANESRLPKPEPGMKWAVNELNQDILVPIDTPERESVKTVAGPISLPPIFEDSPFEDSPDDLL